MEPYPGVFVSRASTDDWEPDPDVPGSLMHELVHADGVWAGFTRITSADHLEPWAPERREVALVIEGSVRIEAPPAPIMAVIADVAAYPEWAEGVRTVEVVSTEARGRPERAARVPGLPGYGVPAGNYWRQRCWSQRSRRPPADIRDECRG